MAHGTLITGHVMTGRAYLTNVTISLNNDRDNSELSSIELWLASVTRYGERRFRTAHIHHGGPPPRGPLYKLGPIANGFPVSLPMLPDGSEVVNLSVEGLMMGMWPIWGFSK